MLNNTTVIIPIYNEEENIWELIDEIIRKYKDIKILIIDDFSNDNSVKIVWDKKETDIISILEKGTDEMKWLCSSIIKWIKNVATPYFIVMDWDFQHPTKNINDFVKLFKLKKNIVIWERENINLSILKFRFILSLLWNLLIKRKFKINLKDPLSWFFWWETKLFRKIIKENPKIFYWKWYKFLFNFLQAIKLRKYKIWTFKFEFKRRKYWKSKININVYITFLKSFFNH